MKKEVVNQESDTAQLMEKREYFQRFLNNNPKLKRQYKEVHKYCKFIKRDLDNILFNEFKGGNLAEFLESVFRDTLIVYFTKMLEFENVNDSNELYNTLYYLSFEYIKLVKKNDERKAVIDKALPDLKVITFFFGSQVLNKDSFKKFDFSKITPKKVAGFLLENNIKTYQSKSKKISKEESEATIVYSLINLYMTSELERVFLTEHLKDYETFKKDNSDLKEQVQTIDNNIHKLEKEMIDIDMDIEKINIQIDKITAKNKVIKQVFYNKKLVKLENDLDLLEKKSDTLLNQNKNNKKKLRSLKSKITKLENEFKDSFNKELTELNNYYQTDLIVNMEDFENKNKLKKKSRAVSNDIIKRLANIGIEVNSDVFTLNDYVKLKEMVNEYKKKFSNRNVYHNKIVELLDKYGYYLKN